MQSGVKGFRRQFLEVTSGSFVAQVLSFVLMPLVTRLYLPAEFGEFALSVAIFSIVGIVANLRLDLAVMIAAEDDEAALLAWLAMVSSLFFGVVAWGAMVLWRGVDAFAFFTAISVFATGVIQTLANWASRKQQFRSLAMRNVLEKILVLAISLACGFMGYTLWGLLAAQTMGLLAACAYLQAFGGPGFPLQWRAKWRQTLECFSDFPLVNIASTLFMTMAVFLPAVLLGLLFQKDDLGQYGLVSRIFEMPIFLVGYAFNTVYFSHTAKMESERRLSVFWRTIRVLLLLSALPVLIVAAFGPSLFSLLFGPNWAEAGSLARLLLPCALARLLFVSQWPMLLVQRKLKLGLVISIALFVAQIGGFGLGYWMYGDVRACVAWMSIPGAIVYLAGLPLISRTLKRP